MKNISLKWNERLSGTFSHWLLYTPKIDQKGSNTYQLLASPELFMTDLLSEIPNAQSNVGVQFYAYQDDAVGRPLAPVLADAAKRELQVRLIVDEFINMAHSDKLMKTFSLDRKLQKSVLADWKATHRMFDEMRSLGVEVQLVNPLGFMKRRKNHRDHRKIIVIDGRTPVGIAYIGGYNPTLHNSKWNDFMVKMTGDIVPILQQDLDLTWDGRSQYGIIPYSDGFVLADAIGHSVIDPILQDLIRHAERRVIIESAYVWGPKITECLIDIASRVEVDIIVPLHRNNKNRYVPSEDFLDEMRRAGARIHKYNGHGGMTHVKAMLVDDIGVFGSHNFNAMMSGKMGEVSIATDNPPLVSQLETFLENDIKNSTLIQTPYFLDRKLR